jgi:hypothetical protein
LQTGDPFTLGENDLTPDVAYITAFSGDFDDGANVLNAATATVDKFSQRMIVTDVAAVASDSLFVDTETTVGDLRDTVNNELDSFHGFNFLNLDMRGFTTNPVTVSIVTIPKGVAGAAPQEILTDGTSTIDATLLGTFPATNPTTVIATAVNEQSLTVVPTFQATLTASALVGGSFTIGEQLLAGQLSTGAASGTGFSSVAVPVTITQAGATTPATGILVDDGDGIITPGVADTLTIVGGGAGFVTTSPVTVTENALISAVFDPALTTTDMVGLIFTDTAGASVRASPSAVASDFFSFGFVNDGLESNERIANQIIRIEAEETGDNTSTFKGTLEYIMVNQLNILDVNTYLDISPIANDPSFIVIEDLTDEDSPRVNYLDLGADGVPTQIADQEEAPSHSGIVSFDLDSYKNADTVVITLEDLDLNVDSDLIDIYTVVTTLADANTDVVGTSASSGLSITLSNGDQLGRLLDITFDDQLWTTPTDPTCLAALATAGVTDTGLGATTFTLIETDRESGVFMGDFQIPAAWCRADSTTTESVTGLDIEVNYVDFRDASGEIIEVCDAAGVRANTGSVSLDRTVYPVPFGTLARYDTNDKTTPASRSLVPIH